MGVDIGADEEPDDVEERHPGVLRQELLRKGQRKRRSHPADLHDGHETSADCRADLVEGACASDDSHRRQIDGVLDGRDLVPLASFLQAPIPVKTYNQIADQDLQDLSLQAGPASEDLLENADEEMAERRSDKHAVKDHLRHAGAEVMAMLADVVGNPRGKQLLQTRERTRGEHLRAQRVRLQLLEVELQITGLGLSAGQPFADSMREVFCLLLDRTRGGFFLELDGHGGRFGWGEVSGHGARVVRRGGQLL